ncbi:Magnesium transporter CorA [Azospirillaceae bacterium]
MDASTPTIPPTIARHFREILLWPLQLQPLEDRHQIQRHWEQLDAADSPWVEIQDDFADPDHFKARRYSEFVAFLPAVQRFLYGEGRDGQHCPSPIRVYGRSDIAAVRLVFKDNTNIAPVTLNIAHIKLYFFYDVDVVILVIETFADDLPLNVVQEILYRFGRSYPSSWDQQGQGDHCLARVEWLSTEGVPLATSDYENREKFLTFVCRQKAAPISADWEFLLAPMVLDASEQAGVLRYRQLEYNRTPLMAYLAVDNPQSLSRADFVRLCWSTRADEQRNRLPFSERFLEHFEDEFCYDRYWGVKHPFAANTRFLCSGHAFVMVGEANHPFFTDNEHGLLGQFRRQYFLVGLIAHFHKAALLMFGDRLAGAVNRLDIRDAENVKRFKRTTRQLFEIFLRFTHRYWFHEVSTQSDARALFDMYHKHHNTHVLYDDISTEVQDMAQYIDSDGLRRQANTVVRLTVVTTFGLIGTATGGFLGMNLISAADDPLYMKVLYFLLAFAPTYAITIYTVMISKRLSDLLEALSDERFSLKEKVKMMGRAWFS